MFSMCATNQFECLNDHTHYKEKASVFSEGSDAASEANDKDERPSKDEKKCRIKWYLTQLAEVLEHILLSPRPQSNTKHNSSQQLYSTQT